MYPRTIMGGDRIEGIGCRAVTIGFVRRELELMPLLAHELLSIPIKPKLCTHCYCCKIPVICANEPKVIYTLLLSQELDDVVIRGLKPIPRRPLPPKSHHVDTSDWLRLYYYSSQPARYLWVCDSRCSSICQTASTLPSRQTSSSCRPRSQN
jgi:hypothetical protein